MTLWGVTPGLEVCGTMMALGRTLRVAGSLLHVTNILLVFKKKVVHFSSNKSNTKGSV